MGSHLLLSLAKSGKAVRALKRRSGSPELVHSLFRGQESLLHRVEWVDSDVTDFFSLEDAMKGVSEVFHCAALVSFHPSDYRRMMKINAGGTANMINAALASGVKKFCHVSSTAAMGRSEEDNVVTEKTVWSTSKHNSAYSISKHCAEREVWRGIEEGLHAFIVNPSIILGPGDWHTGSTALFGEVWKGLRFYPTGASGFVDVRDVVSCMTRLMDSDSRAERYILSAENISYREVINGIAHGFGKPEPVIRVGNFLSELGWRAEAARNLFSKTKPLITKETALNGQLTWLYSNEKIKKELGFEFIPVRRSIEDTCRVFLDEKKLPA